MTGKWPWETALAAPSAWPRGGGSRAEVSRETALLTSAFKRNAFFNEVMLGHKQKLIIRSRFFLLAFLIRIMNVDGQL